MKSSVGENFSPRQSFLPRLILTQLEKNPVFLFEELRSIILVKQKWRTSQLSLDKKSTIAQLSIEHPWRDKNAKRCSLRVKDLIKLK